MNQAHLVRPRSAARAGKEPTPSPDSPSHHANQQPTEISHLNNLPVCRPLRKAAQIRWLWPEISAALAAGHAITEVRQALTLDGLEISYSKLRAHIARLRKSHPHQPPLRCDAQPPAPPPTDGPVGAPPAVKLTSPAARAAEPKPYDPLLNLRDPLTRRQGFQYDDRPPDEKKLI